MKGRYHYIYKTTNLLSGKYYIGMHSTNNLEDGYLGSGKRLYYSIRKYGKGNHKKEILEFVTSREELVKREEEIVDLNEIAKEKCLNLKVGGSGGFSSATAKLGRVALDKILKEKYGEGFKGILFKNWKENLTQIEQLENNNKISKGLKEHYKDKSGTFLNKTHSQKTKDKQSKAKQGRFLGEENSQHNTCWVFNERLRISKKIKKEELINLTSDWKIGRRIKL